MLLVDYYYILIYCCFVVCSFREEGRGSNRRIDGYISRRQKETKDNKESRISKNEYTNMTNGRYQEDAG